LLTAFSVDDESQARSLLGLTVLEREAPPGNRRGFLFARTERAGESGRTGRHGRDAAKSTKAILDVLGPGRHLLHPAGVRARREPGSRPSASGTPGGRARTRSSRPIRVVTSAAGSGAAGIRWRWRRSSLRRAPGPGLAVAFLGQKFRSPTIRPPTGRWGAFGGLMIRSGAPENAVFGGPVRRA
jgi:hypothetical protein